MKPELSICLHIYYFIFPRKYQKLLKIREHIKNFPCEKCRPDLSDTFLHGYTFTCEDCGRVYHL